MQGRDPLWPAIEESAASGVRVVRLRLVAYGLAFATSVMIARALGPEGRGLYALPIAMLGIVIAISHVGLEHANVFLAGRGTSLRRLWGNATLVAVGISFLVWAIAAGLYVATDGSFFSRMPVSWLVVALFQVPLILQSIYWAGLLQLSGRLRSAVRGSLAGAAVNVLMACWLFRQGALTPFRALLLGAAATGTTWLALLVTGAGAGVAGLQRDRRLFRRAMSFGVRAQLAVLFTFLLFRVDQLLVQRILGFRELGFYSLAVVLAEAMWLLTEPFSASLLPYQLRASAGDDRRLGFAFARLSLAIGVVSGMLAGVLAPLGIRLVYGAEFSGSVTPFRLLLPGIVALGVQRPLSALLVKEGRLAIATLFNLAALATNVVLNLVLLPTIGVAGASLATSITYIGIATAYVHLTRTQEVAGWAELIPRRDDWSRILRSVRHSTGSEERSGPLTIVLLIGTLERGGAEGQVVLLAEGLRNRGHRVTVLCLSHAGAYGSLLRESGVEIVECEVRGRVSILHPIGLLRVLRRVFLEMRDRHPDVVQTYLYSGNLVGVPLARFAGAPVVVSSVRSLRGAMHARLLLKPLEFIAIRWSDAVICNSRAVAEDAMRGGGVPKRKVRLVYNGVEVFGDPPSEHRPNEVLVVANLIAYKGHDVALRALARLAARPQAQEVHLRLAGAGPEEDRLRQLASLLGIDGRVEFLGSVADVRKHMARCSITALPSLSEGFPNAILESLAEGRPVVASSVGGVPEALEGGGGVLVPPGDPEALAEALEAMLADPIRADQMGRDGRRLVQARFGADRMIEATIEVYRSVLTRPRRAFEFDMARGRSDG